MKTRVNGQYLSTHDACKRVMVIAAFRAPVTIEPQPLGLWDRIMTLIGGRHAKRDVQTARIDPAADSGVVEAP